MAIFFLLFAGVFFVPLVLSIMAISRANRAIREVEEWRARGAVPVPEKPAAPASAPTAPPAVPAPEPTPAADSARVREEPKPPAPASAPPPLPAKPKVDMELALGGRVASYVGAAAVIIAVAFFVGYAIQQGLIGPVPRVVLSACSAAALLAGGEVFRRKGPRHAALAEALTGGGSALLFFTVFAAHRLYGLIGPGVALAGLSAAAAGVLLIARRADSQTTAIIGTFGAYLTPWLVEPVEHAGVFPLVYVMFVNVPVLLFYRARRWHVLPNVAAICAILHLFISFSPKSDYAPWPAVVFLILVYLGLFGLNLVALARERSENLRTLDVIRLLVVSAAFGLLLTRNFEEGGGLPAAGVPLLVAGLAHAVFGARLARGVPPPVEATACFHLAALYIAFAAVVRFDGLVVPALWGIEGFVLAALPIARMRPTLRALGLFLGVLGLGSTLLDAADQRDAAGRLFLNAHFGVGIGLSLLLALQSRFRKDPASAWYDALALLGAVGVGCIDALIHLPGSDPALGLLTSGIVLAAGAIGLRGVEPSPLRTVGIILLALIPFKLVILDLPAAWAAFDDLPAFGSSVFWLRLAMIGATIALLTRARVGGLALKLIGASAAILMVAVEWLRIPSAWSQAAVSIWLGIAAFAAVGIGLRRQSSAIRYYGLTLFGITVVKVFLVDLAGLRGLERAGAFLATGLLLLALSYLYQRLAASISQRSP